MRFKFKFVGFHSIYSEAYVFDFLAIFVVIIVVDI